MATPMKHHTLPKKVLLTAVTANRIKYPVLKKLQISFAATYLWSDSITAQQSFRIRADNPSNLGTGGLSIKKLMQSVWINGPNWLKSEINETEN